MDIWVFLTIMEMWFGDLGYLVNPQFLLGYKFKTIFSRTLVEASQPILPVASGRIVWGTFGPACLSGLVLGLDYSETARQLDLGVSAGYQMWFFYCLSRLLFLSLVSHFAWNYNPIYGINSHWNISFTEQWDISTIKIPAFINIIYPSENLKKQKHGGVSCRLASPPLLWSKTSQPARLLDQSHQCHLMYQDCLPTPSFVTAGQAASLVSCEGAKYKGWKVLWLLASILNLICPKPSSSSCPHCCCEPPPVRTLPSSWMAL